jgi:hypothetical protein
MHNLEGILYKDQKQVKTLLIQKNICPSDQNNSVDISFDFLSKKPFQKILFHVRNYMSKEQ